MTDEASPAPDPFPQFARSLEDATRDAAARGVRADWVQRLRHLLLAGRSTGALAATTPRVWRRAVRVPLVDSEVVRSSTTPDGATKLLVRLADGNAIETVVLPSPRGVSVCLSTQVGCPIGCRFCASGVGGLVRNLEAHEIVEQLVHARRVDPRVDRLVVMGIGEPMLNAERLFAALDVIRIEGGIGPRRMIVSTVGARGAVRRLLAYGRRVSLALSLHAPDDELRARLIPTLHAERVVDLLADVDHYVATTGRKALAEYALLAGVNDSDEQARRTGRLLEGRQIYLNVIPYNRVDGAPFEPVAPERARRFVDVVRASGAFATVRKTMGGAEHAACGQLRAATAVTGAT